MQWWKNIDYRNLAKLAPRLGALLLILLAIVWLFQFLRTSTVSISTTTTDNGIAIYPVRHNAVSGSAVAHGSATLTAHLHAGTYEISVSGQNSTTTQFVSLGWRRSLSYSLGPPAFAGTEPVALRSTSNLVASSSALYFILAGATGLEKINAQNLQTTVAPSVNFVSAQWFSPGYGVGQVRTGQLYVIQNDTARRLATPSGVLLYAVTPDKHIYLATKDSLYYGAVSGDFQKIAALQIGLGRLVASSNQVALVYGSSLRVVTAQGKLKKTVQLEVSNVAWSPDGTKLAIFSSAGAQVLTDSLHQITPLSGNPASPIAWADNNTVIYGVGGELWQYTMSSRRAVVLANPDVTGNITDLSIDTTSHAAYVDVLDSATQSTTMYRVWLSNKTPSATAIQLAKYFPQTVGVCYADFINFTRPALSLIGGEPTADVCATDLNTALTNAGVPVDAVQINDANVPLSDQQGP